MYKVLDGSAKGYRLIEPTSIGQDYYIVPPWTGRCFKVASKSDGEELLKLINSEVCDERTI